MTDLDLVVGAYPYDQFAALRDGRVAFEGVDARYETAQVVTDVFRRMIVDRAFDVSELGWTYFLRTMDVEDPPFVAIPVFPNRQFRHSAVYVNTASGIEHPRDLAGKTVGEFAVYGHDAGFWPKGILADEFGLTPSQCRWVVGGLDFPMTPVDFIPFRHPDDVEVTRAPDGTDLGLLLDAGDIDALVSADVPRCVMDGSPRVRRLFPDARRTEQDYFRRTGIFPIMHTVVVRRELLAAHPGLAAALYAGFCASKDAAAEGYRRRRVFNNIDAMVPWLGDLLDEDAALLGADWWPYGISANRAALETLLRYHAEQGLSRRMSVEDVFAPELLDT